MQQSVAPDISARKLFDLNKNSQTVKKGAAHVKKAA